MTNSPDDIITKITNAASKDEAMHIINAVPRDLLEKVADLLYIEPEGVSTLFLRREIVKTARN
jgi:hypothetical protein